MGCNTTFLLVKCPTYNVQDKWGYTPWSYVFSRASLATERVIKAVLKPNKTP
jgi:hypothetical protein